MGVRACWLANARQAGIKAVLPRHFRVLEFPCKFHFEADVWSHVLKY